MTGVQTCALPICKEEIDAIGCSDGRRPVLVEIREVKKRKAVKRGKS